MTLEISVPPGVEGGIGDDGEIWFRGIGIHTGEIATVRVTPGPAAGPGVRFVLPDGVTLPADYEAVVDTSRCTVLGDRNGRSVSTVEHLLSALHGLGIQDACIAVDGPEIPILDGSALPWVDALLRAGGGAATGRHASHMPPAPLTDPIVVTGKGGAFLAAYPSDRLRLTIAISFDHPLVGTQVARYEADTGDYASDVAPARTFGFIEEVEALRAAGLARGGSFENAVVIYPDRTSTPLRIPNELAYHKLLDVLGDLFLAFGGPLPIPVDIFAVKPSHRLNVELAGRIAQAAASAAAAVTAIPPQS